MVAGPTFGDWVAVRKTETSGVEGTPKHLIGGLEGVSTAPAGSPPVADAIAPGGIRHSSPTVWEGGEYAGEEQGATLQQGWVAVAGMLMGLGQGSRCPLPKLISSWTAISSVGSEG